MIISDTSASGRYRTRLLFLVIGSFLALGLLYFFLAPAGKSHKEQVEYQEPDLEEYVILCDAEQVLDGNFITAGIRFTNGITQSDSFSLSGNYSSLLKESNTLQFGFTYRIQKFEPGDQFKVSAWRFRPDGGMGQLVVSAINGPEFYIEENYAIAKNKEGWEKLEFFFTAPDHTEALNVYVYSDGTAPIWFDDLRIEKLVSENIYQPQILDIQLKDKHLLKIQNKRKAALKAGLLESSEDDWVKARISSAAASEPIPVSLRLKGDWLDHLRGEKWSFRIKVKDPYAWNRLKTFSVQTPAARDFMGEWILHQLWEKEDILTPRYDFIRLSLNGQPKGIYAFEEHFEKQLVEYKKRREGPIVRFAEDGFWASIKRQLEHVGSELNYALPQPEKNKENAIVRPFSESQTLDNPLLRRQFEAAQKLMHQYAAGQLEAEKIFDLDRLARYFAICDLMGAYHGLVWHNQRFYYNPVLDKLEPVGFDGFPAISKYQSSFIGDGSLNRQFRNGQALYDPLFLQPEFFTRYIQHLYHYTSRAYFDDFLEDIRPELEKRYKLLKMEFPHYQFSEAELIKRAQRIHLQLLPLPGVSLQAFRQASKDAQTLLKLSNVHGLPLEIIGTGKKAKKMNHRLAVPLVLPGYQNRNLEEKYTDLPLERDAAHIFYRTLGLDSVFSAEIIDWQLSEGPSASQQLFKSKTLVSNNLYTITDSLVYFPSGKYQTDRDIIIPHGWRVEFAPGTSLDLTGGAKFISRSAIFMVGTETEPILISSSDGTAGGFTVLQAGGRSQLRHVIFDGLNTLHQESWQLTGAVSFYESDVDILHSVFRNNHCEDGLNIIRSSFLLDQVLVVNAPFDGLDVDFSEGRILNSSFVNTANDGMDFSGSKVLIDNCTMEGCRDKGLSVGEETTARVQSATIRDCNIGIASKDLSQLTVSQVTLENVTLGFTAYQKKPEFGGSRIEVHQYTARDVKRLYSIPPGSVLYLKGRTIAEK